MSETTKKVISCPQTGDRYTYVKHKSGLDILICEMDGFSTTEALFGTKYGSINTQFKTDKDDDYCCVPEGIAHFLEHKLFENEDCDVFDLYAKTGANANAFTSFDKTCYLFSCSDHYQESLKILLSFVQSPYFTPESVAKEQGIIGQEIKMCDDDPGWRVLFNMLSGLYHNHPVKIDIAGTVESIAEITDKLLYRCYNTFYNLHNMVLAVAGNCKEDEVLAIADELLKPCEDFHLETVFPDEPDTIVREQTVEFAPVGVPLFNLGFKCTPRKGYENLKAEMEAYVAVNVLANSASPLYQKMLEEGLINTVFTTDIFNGDGFFTVIFDGESENPEEVKKRVIDEIEKAKITGLDEERFEAVRRSAYGNMVQSFNNVNSVANHLINSQMNGVSIFDTIDVLSNMTLEDANNFLRTELHPEKATLSIVKNNSEVK